MSSSSQSRRKSKHTLEPISYEEMLGTAGMSGFVSFLDVTPSDAIRTPDGFAHTADETERMEAEPRSHSKRELATASETSSLPRLTLSQPALLDNEKGTPDTGIGHAIPSSHANQGGRSFIQIRSIPYIGVPDTMTSSLPHIATSFRLDDEKGAPNTDTPDTYISETVQGESSLTTKNGMPYTGVPDIMASDHIWGTPNTGVPYSIAPDTDNNGIKDVTVTTSGIPDSKRTEIQPTPILTKAARDLGRGLDTNSPLISSNRVSPPGSGTPELPSASRHSKEIIQKQTSEHSGEPLSISVCRAEADPLPGNVAEPPVAARLEPPTAVFGDGPLSEDGGFAGELSPQVGVPESGVPIYTTYRVLQQRTQRIRRATRVQDGHSLGEQALYDSLWQAGHPYSSDARAITIGYRHMSELARLTVNNCKANIRALIQKLAVAELSPFSHAHGTTYLIYNFSAILQRRRNAGFTHCIRSRGVVFVDPNTGRPLTTSTHIKSGIPDSRESMVVGIPESDKTGAPEVDRSGIPNAGPHIDRNRSSQHTDQETTSTFAWLPKQSYKSSQAAYASF